MGAVLNLVEHNLHEVQVGDTRMLFHIPSSSLFALDNLTSDILDRLRGQEHSAEALVAELSNRFTEQEITETVRELLALELVNDGRPLTDEIGTRRVDQFPLTTVVLNVNTGCNLSCTYCYKEDLDIPSAGRKMELQTAT
jgi:uncharacterized protein